MLRRLLKRGKNGKKVDTIFVKKEKIIGTIKKMNNDELFNLHGFLVDILIECAKEMRKRKE